MAAQPDPMSTPAGTQVAGGVARSNVAPRLPYEDLRQWLEAARRLGEVKEVSGLNCEQEIGLVAGVAMHDDSAPCFVFDRIPGAIEGSRVLVNFFGGRRKNMTLGFPAELNKIELSEGFRTNYLGPMPRIAPKYVEDGPIFQNVLEGDAVDLTRFPAPKWHAADGAHAGGGGLRRRSHDLPDGVQRGAVRGE